MVFPQIRSGATADPGGYESLAESGFGILHKMSPSTFFITSWKDLAQSGQSLSMDAACQEPSRHRCQHPEFKRYSATFKPQIFEVHWTTDQPVESGQFQAWLVPRVSNVRGSLVGSCWLYSLNIGDKTGGTKNLGSSPRKGPKKWQDFASLTEHEAIWSTVLYPVSCPAGATSSPNKI